MDKADSSRIYPSPFDIDEGRVKAKDVKDRLGRIYSKEYYDIGCYYTGSDKLLDLELRMNSATFRVYNLIRRKLEINSNAVIFTIDDYRTTFNDYNKNHFYEGVKNNIELGIIAKYKKDNYVVNHNLLFKGNLSTFINDYIIFINRMNKLNN